MEGAKVLMLWFIVLVQVSQCAEVKRQADDLHRITRVFERIVE